MGCDVIRVTAVPRSNHPASGLQAMHYARHYGDIVWALPAEGDYIGEYASVHLHPLDRSIWKGLLGVRFVRAAFLGWLFLRALFMPNRLFIVHSFIFALPLCLLGRGYYVFVHGSDRRFIETAWGRAVVRRSLGVFGVGFGLDFEGGSVVSVPNIFAPREVVVSSVRGYDVLFVLRNAPVKNPLFPIDLARELGRAIGIRVGVVGVAECELPSDRQEELRSLQRDGVVVEYLGRKDSDAVMELMAASRVLLLPSLSEGVPKVVLEAMFQGMNVIVNRDISLPPVIAAHCDAFALGDWVGLAALLRARAAPGRNEANIQAASEYLAASQHALTSIYDEIYRRYRDSNAEA